MDAQEIVSGGESGKMMEGSDEKKDQKAGDGGVSPQPPPPPVWFWELFRFADRLDYVLMVIGAIGALVHGCTIPLFYRVMANLLNSFGGNANNVEKMSDGVAKNALYYLIVGAVIWASSWIEVSCWMWTGERQSAKMRIKYLEAALNQDIQFYDTEIQTSDVVLGINSDAVTVQDAISEKLGNFIHYVAIFISGFAVGFSEVWQLALANSGLLPLIFGIGYVYAPRLGRLAAKSQEARSQAGNISEQTIVHIRTVFAYVGESKALQAYSAALKMVQKVGYKNGFVKGLNQGSISMIIFCTYGLLIWFGGYSVKHHYGNGAEVITTMCAIMVGGQSVTQAIPSIFAFTRARAAAAKIFLIIDQKPSIDRNNDSGFELDTVHGKVELKNVNFSYPSRPQIQVLNNLSLVIPAGNTVALVGSSGSGKSTVVSLIERFYDPTSGNILVDGHDIKTLKLRWVRQQIGLVSQEPALFATTIKQNILLGRPDATTLEIEEAAKVANAHSFILKLPDGYDTQVGEKGTKLSGGQKQRIAIARAMLKNPAVLLLDEATSALDSESEKLVQEALDRFMIARTTLVIAHRLSTIRKADLVAVLQQGSLVEIGKHDELIAMGENSIYAELVNMQAAGHHHHHNSNTPVQKTSISARSSRRNSFGSPQPTTASIMGLHSPASPAGIMSPCLRQLSEISNIPDIINDDDDDDYDGKEEEERERGSFWRLAKINAPEWPYALIGSISSVLCGSLNALHAYVLSAVLGVYYSPDTSYMMKEVTMYCYILLGASVAGLIFFTLQIFFWDIAGENLTKRVKEKMLASILKNEISWFDKSENESSRVSARLELDANNVRSAIGERISLITQNSALLIISCTVAFAIDWRLTLVIIAVFPIMIGAGVLQKLFTQGFSGNLEAAHAKGALLAGEAIANLRTVAAFNSESNMVGMFASNLDAPLRRCFWKGQISGSLYGVCQFSLYASFALGLWYASLLVRTGKSDFSKSIRVFMILSASAYSAAETLAITPDLVKGGRAIRSVFKILDRDTQIESDDPNATKVSGRLQGEIEFRNVHFTYPTRPDVLVFRGLSFYARPGKTLALVGPSGCGKSSVISLIQRFYEPFSGRITIDRTDIRKFNLKSLRRHMALVPQEPCLFATSIYDNILYGGWSSSEPEPTEAEVIEAATLANAHKFISSLPQGYKTFAGERGVQLSGGQKQRIALARAFLKKPDILLLDEATSALDSETEMEVRAALDRVCQGKTTIVVAHRLATIRTAHSILVIDNGKVAEQGSDSQLVKKTDGIYSRMIQLQLATTS